MHSIVYLILGGDAGRERHCLEKIGFMMAKGLRHPVWVTGPALTDDCLTTCRDAGVDVDVVRVDYRALDTLSNFTTMIPDMRKHYLGNLVIMTSESHERRARAIARVILPYYGITLRDIISVPSSPNEKHDTTFSIIRDFVRAILWIIFGFDVSYPLLVAKHPERIEQRHQRVQKYTYEGKDCYTTD